MTMQVYLSEHLATAITRRDLHEATEAGRVRVAKVDGTLFFTGRDTSSACLLFGEADAVLSDMGEQWPLQTALNIESYAWFTFQKCSKLIVYERTTPLLRGPTVPPDPRDIAAQAMATYGQNSHHHLAVVSWKEKDMEEVVKHTKKWLMEMSQS